MAYDKIEEYKKRLAEMYKAKSNDKLNTDENVETLLTPNKTPNNGNYSFGGTMAELGDNLLTGWHKGIEGIIDTGITLAGHVGSWFGADTKWAEKAVSVDATDALMNDMFGGMREKANESYTNLLPETFQQGYDGITTSIGQMLPSIALGAVGGALGAGSKVVQGISMASFGAGAMGTSVEEGLNEGATFGEATGYGVLQGGKELATEWVGNKVFGSKLFGVFGDTAEIGIKSLAKEAIGEGMEEVISTAFDPIVRKITIDKDKSLGELYEGIGEEMVMSFITGAITGGIMGGASTSVQVARYGVDGVNAMNTVQEANEVVQKMVALEKTVVNNESKTQKMEGYKKELENLYDVYTSQIKNLETKYGADSKKAEKMNALSEYFSAIKNSSAQDLAIRDAIDEFNRKNKTNFKYNAYNQAEYTKIVKLIQGKNFNPSDAQSNAFILTDNGIVVNRDSEAYQQGRLYNVIGHEFIHSIEKTEGYKELFNNFVKGFTQEELNAKIQEYGKDKGYGFKNGAEYLLQEAFADYIGENVAINYKEFSKMLGTKSVWSKIKDALTGYRSSLTIDLKQVQSKVSNALKTAKDTSMEMAKASRNLNENWEEIVVNNQLLIPPLNTKINYLGKYTIEFKLDIVPSISADLFQEQFNNHIKIRKQKQGVFIDEDAVYMYEVQKNNVVIFGTMSIEEYDRKMEVYKNVTTKFSRNKNNSIDERNGIQFKRNSGNASDTRHISSERGEGAFVEEVRKQGNSHSRPSRGIYKTSSEEIQELKFSKNKSDYDDFEQLLKNDKYSLSEYLEKLLIDNLFFTEKEDNSYFLNEDLKKPYFDSEGNFKESVIKNTSYEEAFNDLLAITKVDIESYKWDVEHYNFSWFEEFVSLKLEENNANTYENFERIIKNYKRKLQDKLDAQYKREANKGYRSPNFMPKNIKTIADTIEHRQSGKTLMFSQERIQGLIDTNSAGGHKHYAKAFTSFISPQEFLELTLPNAEAWFQADVKKLDLEQIKKQHYRNYDNMLLEVDMKTGEVLGHEGRHRMYALMQEGFTNVQILIMPRNYNKYKTNETTIPKKLLAQTFRSDEGRISSLKVDLLECVPLSEANRDRFKEMEKYLPKEDDNFVRFSRNKTDSNGTKLTENQIEFFKESQVRDENGNLMVMYHGSPKAGFTVFNTRLEGSYFTSNREYAKIYSKFDDSKIYEVYLNITKPFNINNPKCKKIYFEEYIKGGWSNYYDPYTDIKMINGLRAIDWTEGPNLYDFLQEKHPEYDGMIMDEYGAEDNDRGVSYVAFEENQIKLTSNKKPTESNDIRFSKNKANKRIETKTLKKNVEQVEGEIVETGLSTEVKQGKGNKTKQTQTPLTTDSALAWKFYSNLMNDKVYNKSNADGFINAIEQDIKNKFGNDAKVDFKGNKEQLGKNLFQDLNNPSNVSKEQAVKQFLEYFSQIEVNGVSIKEALNNIDPVLYDDFIKQMNDNLVSLFNSGTQSKMDKVISTYTNRINKLKEALREERDYAKELLKTVKVLKSTVAKHKGKNASMTSLDISNTIPELNTLIVELEQLLSRTDYLKSDFRTYMAKVKEAFTKNEYLQRAGYLDADLLADMDTIIQNSASLGNKKITKDEMKILRKICNAINKVYNEYDETVLNGKRVVASQEAIEAIEQIKVKDQKGKGVVSKLNAVENLTGQNMRTKLTLMSNKTYEDSFGRKIMGSLEQASNKKKEIYFDLTDSYHKKMTDKRRNLVKKLEKSNFSFGGVKFNDAQIITLYMTALRGDVATRHLLGEGVRIRDKNGLQTKAIKLTQENLDDIRKYVESNYADFIVELKEIFHKKAGKYYNETLSTRTGYEDSLEANYFPMKSSDLDFTANVMDQSKLMAQYQEFLSPSFTKEVQKTANNSLIIESIDVVVETFSRTMSNFAGITPTIQHLNRLFNTPVEYNGQTTSLMQYIKENYYENFDKEFSRLLINMQDRRTTGSVNKLGAKVRSGIASASLGGNPKIWFLQIASFPIAVSELGFFNSIRGVNSLPLDASKIAEISPYFKDRWENNDVRNAMLNTTNVAGKASTAVGKIGEFFSKPINWFSKMLDKAVIKASIAKVARDNKMTINQVRSNPQLLAEAVALAEQVCRRTQSQYDVLESGSTIYESGELMKSFYMFSSDARVIGNLLRTKLHDAISSKNFKPLLKAMTGVFLTQVIVALLDVAYRAFLDKNDDEDEDGKITDDMFHDFLIGTAENMTVNLIPIARDVYNKFVHGYDLNNVTLDYFNDLIDTISSMTNKLGSGETTEKDIYNFTKVFGTTFGIPVKNLSELVTAIFTKTNAEWAIRTQDILYSKSSSDSKNDIIYSYNNGKVSKLVGQTGALFSKAGLDTPNTKACTEMARLYSKGFTQIYPTVDIDTFTYEGQQFRLSEAQQAKFSDIYNDATKELELLISSPAYYKLKDTDKAKAIKKVYSLYYNLAKAEFIQDYEYSPTEEALFELDAHDLVLYLVHIDTIKATTALSKKEQVIRYLNRQGLNKKELEAIFNILGYKVNSSNSILGNSMLSNSLFN